MSQTTGNNLLEIVESSGLEKEVSASLKDQFLPFFDQAEEWKKKAESLVVTDESQIREMKMAREARLALRAIRVDADKKRKSLKEESLRYGKAVQGVYNVIEYLIKPIEKHLEEQEKFVEIQEAKRKAELKAQREVELAPYSEFLPVGLNLEDMSDEDYNKLLSGAKLQKKAEEERRIKEEKERVEREERESRVYMRRKELASVHCFLTDQEASELGDLSTAEFECLYADMKANRDAQLEEEARIKAENERLQREQEAERKERERIAAQLKAKEDAEKAAAEQKRKEEEEFNNADDKTKLNSLAERIESIEVPNLKGKESKLLGKQVEALLAKVVKHIKDNL